MSGRASASVVITTRNRKAELLRAVESCFAQDHPDVEVLVYDDASTDGTSEALVAAWRGVRLARSEENVGYIKLRNRGFHEARGKYVFSLDDDACFSDRSTIRQTVEFMDNRAKVAAVAIPYVEPRNAHRAMKTAPLPGTPLRGYIGCAHAVRRDVALELGGYREFFFHQGEERDLCIRLLDRGYEIVYGVGEPIVHLCSPVRDQGRLNYYGVRNTLLFDWLNVPQPYVLPALARHAFALFCYKLRPGNAVHRMGYVVGGLGACLRYWRHRRPVTRSTYRKYLSLPAHGPIPASPGR